MSVIVNTTIVCQNDDEITVFGDSIDSGQIRIHAIDVEGKLFDIQLSYDEAVVFIDLISARLENIPQPSNEEA